MSTRTERRREQTHELLLDALYDAIVEGGLDHATVAEVAERADLAVGTFYNHFDSRDDAIAELVRRSTGSLGTTIRDLINDCDDMRDAVDLLARGALGEVRSDDRWARFMAEISRSNAWPRSHLSVAVADVIVEGQRRGQLDVTGDPYQRAFLIGAQMRAMYELVVDPTQPDVNDDMFAKALVAAAGG